MHWSILLSVSTDGRKPFPINHGETSDDSFLEVGIENILKWYYTKFNLAIFMVGWASGFERQNYVYSILKYFRMLMLLLVLREYHNVKMGIVRRAECNRSDWLFSLLGFSYAGAVLKLYVRWSD